MERRLPPSYEGSVVLELGGDVGALVLYVPAELEGEELELLPLDADRHQVHTEVRPRHVAGKVIYAAVYADLPAGRWVVELSGQELTVTGGAVLEAQLATDSVAAGN